MRIGRIALMWLCAVSLASADEAAAFTREVGARLGQIPALYARFSQSKHLAMLEKPLVSEGALCFQRPGYLRWQTETPFRAITVSTPERLAQFEWIDGHWQRLDLGMEEALRRVMNEVSRLLEGRVAERQDAYTITLGKIDDQPVLTLVPKAEGARQFVERIEARFNPAADRLERLTLHEPGGDFTVVDFFDQRAGQAFPANTFSVDTPLDLDDAKDGLQP